MPLKHKGFTQSLLVLPQQAPEGQKGIIETGCHRIIPITYPVRDQGYCLQNTQLNPKMLH